MADNNKDTLKWEPILSTEFRTIEFKLKTEESDEEKIREIHVVKDSIKELAKEIGVSLDTDEFEVDDRAKINQDKKLLEQFEYLQAFKNGEYWSVQSVRTIVLQSGKEIVKATVSAGNDKLTALEAVGKLAAFEAFAVNDISPFEISGSSLEEERKELGERHFIYAGEQEGLLFDERLDVHTRLNKFVLPTDANFNKKEIERASERWDKATQRIANIEISTDSIIEEMSASVPDVASIDKVLTSMKATKYMDEFVNKISEATQHLETYIRKYKETGQGHLIEDAIDALIDKKEGALAILNKMKSDNIVRDITKWENFVREAHIACYVVHAQAMLNLLDESIITDPKTRAALEDSLHIVAGSEDMDGNVKKVGEMEKIAKKYDIKPSLIAAAKRAMAKTTGPELPSLLTDYLDRYKDRKAAYLELKEKGKIAPPETMLPPTQKLSLKRFKP